MKFKTMTAAEYRAMSPEQLEERRQTILEEAGNAESEVDAETLTRECDLCEAEIEYRERFAALRAKQISEVNAGAGDPIARSKAKKQTPEVEDDPLDTPEYRNAFMEYVCRRKPMPQDLMDAVANSRGVAMRGDAFTETTDVPVMIPTVLSNRIIEELEVEDDLFSKVTVTNVKGGVEYPVLDLAVEAFWVGENEVSEWQELLANEKISFSYHELESRIAQTMLASIVTFDEFQRRFVPLVVKAMRKKVNEGIVRGTGSGQMKGILNDDRIANVQTMNAKQMADWKEWRKRIKKNIHHAYRNGGFIMAQSTWDGYIETFADDNNAPVSIGYNPVTGVEEKRLMGFPVWTVEDTTLPDFDDAKVDDVFAIYGDLSWYCINTNHQMQTVQYDDWDIRKRKTVAYMVLDGKVLDPYGFMLIKRGAEG